MAGCTDGVVTASGLALVYLNRERTVVRDIATALSIAGRF